MDKRQRDAGEEQEGAAKKPRYELPTVVRVTHANKDDPDLVYIGREWKKGGYDFAQSKWHNPFFLKKDATPEERQACIERYRNHIKCTKSLYNALPELAGKKLGCWCKPHCLLREYVPPPVKHPLFHMVGTRARFRLDVDFETIGTAKPFDPANALHARAFKEEDLEKHIEEKILNTKWQFGPLNPVFAWSYPDLDVECDMPPEGASKMESEISILKFMSYEKGAYMYDMRRESDGKVITVEIHVVGKRMPALGPIPH